MISVTIQSPDFQLGAAWDDLVSRAQPNAFMSPAALQAADATTFAKIHMLLAWDDSVEPRRLVGLWAMQQRRTWPLGPLVLDALPFNYAFLSSPVIDPAFAAGVMTAFLNAIADTPGLPRIVVLKSLDIEAASYAPLVAAVEASGGRTVTLKTENRPVIHRDALEKSSGERRKKLRQGWKRMSALGVTAIVSVTTPDATPAAFETFLDLEFRSWKGAAGTALLCREADATFVRRMIADMAMQGQVAIQSLQIDGKTIATQVLLFSGTTAYTWKTAFDQAYARFSPGAVLIDRVTDNLFSTTTIDAIDSCSVEGSFMGDLWRGRRAMADVMISVGQPTIGFRIEAARQIGRERLKTLLHRIKAWRAARKLSGRAAAVAVMPNALTHTASPPLAQVEPAAAPVSRPRSSMRTDA